MRYPQNPLQPIQYMAAFLVGWFLLFLFFGCSQPPKPPGPSFAKVNGQPTDNADVGQGRGEIKAIGDLAASPKFPVVYFEYDSDEIRSAERLALSRAARGFRADWVCYVDGHASPEGAEAYNQDLGARRASRVGYFIQAYRGITVIETSYGEERPAAGGPELSRRVEVVCR